MACSTQTSHQAISVDKNASQVYQGGSTDVRVHREDFTSTSVCHNQNAIVVSGLKKECQSGHAVWRTLRLDCTEIHTLYAG